MDRNSRSTVGLDRAPIGGPPTFPSKSCLCSPSWASLGRSDHFLQGHKLFQKVFNSEETVQTNNSEVNNSLLIDQKVLSSECLKTFCTVKITPLRSESNALPHSLVLLIVKVGTLLVLLQFPSRLWIHVGILAPFFQKWGYIQVEDHRDDFAKVCLYDHASVAVGVVVISFAFVNGE